MSTPVIKKTSLYIQEDLLKELKKLSIDYDLKVNDLLLIGALMVTVKSKTDPVLIGEYIDAYKDTPSK